MLHPKILSASLLLCLPFSLAAEGAWAQGLEPVERLARATETPSGGIALAREQTANGALLAALATLERVILTNPENAEARLLHAGLLCQLDDRAGSLVEFDALRGYTFAPSLWEEATAPCQVDKASN